MKYDIYLVGIGGQGVLTLGDLITEVAANMGIPVNLYPTKGMAQRGGFVKVQLRLDRQVVGPQIPQMGADLVVAMERSEALKAIRFVRPGGHFVLFDHVWQPTDVLLGKAPYPELEMVKEQVQVAEAEFHYLDPDKLPNHNGQSVAANIYVLGAVIGRTPLASRIDAKAVAELIEQRWERGLESNQLAFQTGLGAE